MSHRGPATIATGVMLQAITRAVGDSGTVQVSAAQDRHHDEEAPEWTVRIEGTALGAAYVTEHTGPRLGMLLNDASAVLATLGVDVIATLPEQPD